MPTLRPMTEQGSLTVSRTGDGLTHRNTLRKRIVAIRAEQLTFLTDHGLLRPGPSPVVELSDCPDYRFGGPFFKDMATHHFQQGSHSYPISQTKGSSITVQVSFTIAPLDASVVPGEIEGHLVSSGDAEESSFLRFSGVGNFGNGAATEVVLTAKAPLADRIHALEGKEIAWTVRIGGKVFDAGRTGPHDIYVTYDTPNDDRSPEMTPFGLVTAQIEFGITVARMKTAIGAITMGLAKLEVLRKHLAGKGKEHLLEIDEDSPFTLAQALNHVFGSYILTKKASVPEDFNHPSFFGWTSAGAWPAFFFREQQAECQAMVRFVRAALRQVGCPGNTAWVVVYASPVPNPNQALEDGVSPPDPAPDKYYPGTPKLALGLHRFPLPNAALALAGGEYKVGEQNRPDLNSYEACTKISFGGDTRYFPGGLRGLWTRDRQEVLHVFKHLLLTDFKVVLHILGTYPLAKLEPDF